MNMEVVSTSFALGLSASLGCVGACMPVFTPSIISESRSVKSGIWFSLIFSLSRLVVYSILAIVFFKIGANYLTGNTILDKWLSFSLAAVLVIYGITVIVKAGRKNQCNCHGVSRKVMAILLGMLVGAFSCPALWIAIMVGVRTSQITNVILSVTTFWLASSFLIVLLGVIAVKIAIYYRIKKGLLRINVVCGLVLVISGLFYFIRGW